MAIRQITPKRESEKAAYIYVITSDGGPVKVGYTVNTGERLSQLRASSPVPLELLHAEAVPYRDRQFVEKYAHALLWSRRVSGEWFDVTGEQALSAVKLAVVGTAEGRLPPSRTMREKRPTVSPKRKQRETPWGGGRDIAANKYADMCAPTAVSAGRYDPGADVARREALRAVNSRVREVCGPIAVTLLSLVVAQGCAVTSLPGSGRQAALFRQRIEEALDCVGGLTVD